MANFEDFGDFGDESFLDAHEFALEQNELRAMQYEEEQKLFAELADASDYEGSDDDCPLDGDAESALASAGWGNDEDYGSYEADPYDCW